MSSFTIVSKATDGAMMAKRICGPRKCGYRAGALLGGSEVTRGHGRKARIKLCGRKLFPFHGQRSQNAVKTESVLK